MPTPNFYTHGGKTQHITDWAKELGISFSALYSRLDRGWSFDDAIKVKPRKWASLHNRFLAAVTFEPNTGCWLWCGYTSAAGYGQIGTGKARGTIYAHRYSYEHFKGHIPDGLYVLHSCDQPACCNPDHLSVGTHADNMAQMNERDRRAKAHPNARGELNHEAKLTEAAVKDIRSGRMSIAAFATLYGVNTRTVECAAKRKTWKHVP